MTPFPSTIYMLSCEGELKRRSATIKEIHRVFGDVAIHLIEGIDSRKDGWPARITFPLHGSALGGMDPGAICCADGHLRIARDILLKRLPHALIFEDDIRIIRPLETFVQTIISLTRLRPIGQWKWCILQNHGWNPAKMSKTHTIASAPIRPCHETSYGTGCWMLSNAGAQKLLTVSLPIRSPIDAVIRFQSCATDSYNASSPYATTGHEGSIIGQTRIPDEARTSAP